MSRPHRVGCACKNSEPVREDSCRLPEWVQVSAGVIAGELHLAP